MSRFDGFSAKLAYLYASTCPLWLDGGRSMTGSAAQPERERTWRVTQEVHRLRELDQLFDVIDVQGRGFVSRVQLERAGELLGLSVRMREVPHLTRRPEFVPVLVRTTESVPVRRVCPPGIAH